MCATRSSRPASADGRVVSTADVLAACGIDPASPCAGMMTYQWPDFGIPPTEQPFFLYACKVAYHCEVVHRVVVRRPPLHNDESQPSSSRPTTTEVI